MRILKIILARWRLVWGFCPHCNSDAPTLYNCPVCHYYTGKFPPDKDTKFVWWFRFKTLILMSKPQEAR